MQKPERPENESNRIAMLQSLNLLDTACEERFDRLTRMAVRLFDVPIAQVSLVDENRQWFKSCIGIGLSETPRDISFCSHAILENDVFIINDANKDPRFMDNELVLQKPNVRFYAGCPLVVSGFHLGTLCLVDYKPRDFSEEDIATLKDLTLMVEKELTAVQLATVDDLTGIANRRGFLSLAENSLHFSVLNRVPMTLVYMDLDCFKCVNDTLGHAEGDTVLIAFATLLQDTFRNSDIAARLGGDEFVLLLNNATQLEAQKIFKKLKVALAHYNQQKTGCDEISFSYGMVEFHANKHSAIEGLMSAADMDMYQWKHLKK